MAARVYDRFFAYARGFLRGGRLDAFFSKTLRRLDLDLSAVEMALQQAFPTETEAGVARPLAAWGDEAFTAWGEGAQRLLGAIAAERLWVEITQARPARAFVEALTTPS